MTVKNDETGTLDLLEQSEQGQAGAEEQSVDTSTPPDGISQEEWDALSEAEREALKTPDEPESPSGSEEGEPGEGEEGEEQGKEISDEQLEKIAGTEEGEPEGTPEPEGKPAEPSKDAEQGAPVSDDDLLKFRPVVDESKIPVVQEVIPPETQSTLDELDKKLEDGEIPMSEYNRERDKINRGIAVDTMRRQDAVKAEYVATESWRATQAVFFEARPEYNKLREGAGFKERTMFAALNEAIKSISEDPKYAHLSDMAQLIEADRMVKEQLGIIAPKPGTLAAAPNKDVPKKPAAKVPDTPNLGDVPIASAPEVGSRFAAINKLTGKALEDAVAAMNESEYKAWMAEQGR